MSTNQQQDADKILRELFSHLKTESPSSDFTQMVMARVAPEFVHVESVEPFKISGRIWLAIFVSVVFFSLLFFTSDIPAFDFLNQYLNFSWITNFTLSDRVVIFFQQMVAGFDELRLNYILIPLMALLGLVGIDRIVNRKTGTSTFFSFV